MKRLISILLVMSILLVPLSALSVGAATGEYKSWKQYDARWGDKTFTGGNTMARSGCVITSLAMLLVKSGLRSEGSFDPGVLCDFLTKNGGFSDSGDIFWASVEKFEPAFTYEKRVELSGSDSAKTDDIKKYLSMGYYIVAMVKQGGHYVAIDRIENGRVIMLDPGSDAVDLFAKYTDWATPTVLRLYGAPASFAKKPDVPTLQISDPAPTVGDTVTFSFWADNAEGYWLDITENGETVETVDCGANTEYSYFCDRAGMFSARVTAWSSAGESVGETVYFNVSGAAPEVPSVVGDKQILPLGDSVTLTASGEGAQSFVIDILDGDGLPLFSETVLPNEPLTCTPDSVGTYTVSVTAVNQYGTARGGEFYFTVYEPSHNERLMGDVNGDGAIDSMDALLTAMYDASLAVFDDEMLKAADVNGDGVVDSMDAMLIARVDSGLLAPFGTR